MHIKYNIKQSESLNYAIKKARDRTEIEHIWFQTCRVSEQDEVLKDRSGLYSEPLYSMIFLFDFFYKIFAQISVKSFVSKIILVKFLVI